MHAERMNSRCFCVSLNQPALDRELEAALEAPEIARLVRERCPYLFSARPVFVSDKVAAEMAAVIRAVDELVHLPAYREAVLADAPAIALHDPKVRGVFYGYDFHVAGDRVGLIEINTNAGGAMLNAVAARAHHVCCGSDARLADATDTAPPLEDEIVRMFLDEWKCAGTGRKLKTVAIVDTSPQEQYLYPEFLLFRRLFERHGLRAVIAAPEELKMSGDRLLAEDTPIDLVYNRLTDFMLATPASEALRTAYLRDAVVLTPNPRGHALYANKRNLALIGDDAWLEKLHLSGSAREVLRRNVLKTEIVDADNAERLWAERRAWFFKPAAGFGSRAAYRGDKLTKRVWQEIVSGGYVAQALMMPGERAGGARDNPHALKFDIRCYVYNGKIQWMAARLYQGQTTNFRTEGGGFAPVYALPDPVATQAAALADQPADRFADGRACCGNDCQ